MIFLQLFWSFLQVGLFSIGGGYAAMPLIQGQVVEKYHWITMGQFSDLITIAEMTPGPIAVNSATFVGINIAGLPGAAAATMGCIFPSLFICAFLSHVYYKYKKLDLLQNILGSLRPAVVALIAGAGLSILKMVVFQGNAAILENVNWLGIIMFACAFFAIRKLKVNPILAMVLCGAASVAAGSFGLG